jgi:hypothetical protein
VKQTLDIPVVLIIYRRPDTTRQVMDAIRLVAPVRLFIIGDGPNHDRPGEVEQVAEARRVASDVDWDCTVTTDFSEINLGLKKRIAGGLSWVFDQVETAIVLEDDCVPHPSFFFFCRELLDRYADDERIMSICGVNYQFGRNPTPYSYYFSIYNHVSGWATWRRAWNYFDGNLERWPAARDRNALAPLLPSRSAIRYWNRRFQDTYSGKIDSWAYAWTFACWMQNALAVIPARNLVCNIGSGLLAAHSHGRRDPRLHIPAEEMPFPLIHPPAVARHLYADEFTQSRYFRTHWLAPIKRRLKFFLARFS